MSDINQVKNSIKEELEKEWPSPRKILSHLFSLRIYEEGLEFDPKDKWRYLPDTEFYDIVWETFKTNPEFYIKKLYYKVERKLYKDFRKRRKRSGISSKNYLKEMYKYIIEKYCINDGEQILFKKQGLIARGGVGTSIGTLYVTNYRIIAEGFPIKNTRELKRIINLSEQQKCYGSIFPIKNLSKLKKKKAGVGYKVDGKKNFIKLAFTLNDAGKLRSRVKVEPLKLEEDVNKLFEILAKHSKEEVRYQG